MKLRSTATKIVSLVLCLMLGLSSLVFADTTNDYTGHWAEESIKVLFDKGFVTGYTDGTFKPDAQIQRAEFMAIVNRAFGYNDIVEISFKDVKEGDWHYEHVARAVKSGYIKGFADGTMRPTSNITRQEAAVILSRILGIEQSADMKILASIKDGDKIPEWSAKGIAAVVSNGYISLNKDSSFEPAKPITRAAMAVAVEKSYVKQIKKIYAKSGIYTGGNVDGSVKIDNKDITLMDTVINGDLTLGEGIGDGNVHLINVKVKGNTIVKGGGENSIIIENCNFSKIIIIKEDNKVRILAKGNTTVDEIDVQSGAKLESQNLTGEGFGYVTIAEGLEGDALVQLIGNFEAVEIRAEGVHVQASGGTIGKLEVANTATNANIDLAKDVKVTTFTTNAPATVTGTGKIETAQVNVSGTKIEVPVAKIEAPSGVKVDAPKSVPVPSAPISGGGGGSSSGGGGNSGGGGTTAPTINLSVSDVSVIAGGTVTPNVTVVPSDAAIRYETLDPRVAVVENGLIKGINRGKVTIKATATKNGYNSKTVSFNVAVTKSVEDFKWFNFNDNMVEFEFPVLEGATSVKIQQLKEGTENWVDAITEGSIDATSTNARVRSLKNNTKYSFRLVVSGGLYAGVSNVVEVTTESNLQSLHVYECYPEKVELRFSRIVDDQTTKVEVYYRAIVGSEPQEWSVKEVIKDQWTKGAFVVDGLQKDTLYDFYLFITGGRYAGASNWTQALTPENALYIMNYGWATFNGDEYEGYVSNNEISLIFNEKIADKYKPYVPKAGSYLEYTELVNKYEWGEWNKLSTNNTPNVVIRDLKPNTRYRYRLVDKDLGKSRIYYTLTEGNIQDFKVLMPYDYEVENTIKFTLTYDETDEIEVILEKDFGDEGWQPVEDATSKFEDGILTISELEPGTRYWVQLYVLSGPNQGYSNSIDFTTAPTEPGTPTVAANSSNFTVSWQPSATNSVEFQKIYILPKGEQISIENHTPVAVFEGNTDRFWSSDYTISDSKGNKLIPESEYDVYVCVKFGYWTSWSDALGSLVVPKAPEEPEYKPMSISYEANEFTVGEQQEFTVTTVANDDIGIMVRAHFEIPASVSVEYYEVNDGKWYTLGDVYGPSSGFPIADATSKFRAVVSEAGTYTVKVEFKEVGTGKVLAEKDIEVKAKEVIASKFTFDSIIQNTEYSQHNLIWINFYPTGDGDATIIDFNDLIIKVGEKEYVGQQYAYEGPANGYFDVYVANVGNNNYTGIIRIKDESAFEEDVNVTITGRGKLLGEGSLKFKLPVIKIAEVKNLDELKAALSKYEIEIINITENIDISEKILVNRPVTINGGGKTITFTDDTEGWQGNYILHVYKVTDVSIKDLKLMGGDAALLVNGAEVTLTGIIDVSGSEFGGIEVSKGVGVDIEPNLTVTGAIIINTTEAYGLPTIWEDGVTSKVTANEGQFKINDKVKDNQVQYYLEARNAQTPKITLSPATGEATVVQGSDLIPSEVILSSNYNANGLKTFISLKKGEAAVNFSSVFETFNLSTKVGEGAINGPYKMVGDYSSFQYGPTDGFAASAGVNQVTTTTGRVKAGAEVGTYTITTEVKNGDTLVASAVYTLIVEAADKTMPVLGGTTLENDENGNLILTVKAIDEGNNLASLEVDHSLEGILPEFTLDTTPEVVVNFDDSDPRKVFNGTKYTYANGTWTVYFNSYATNIVRTNASETMTFYFVIKDEAGNQFGDMYNVTPEMTRVLNIPKYIVPPTLSLSQTTAGVTTEAAIANTNGRITGAFSTVGRTYVDVTLKKGTVNYSNVRVVVEGGNDGIQLLALDVDGENIWYDIVKTGWGTLTGFPIADATTPVYVVANKAGTYDLTIKLIDVSNNNNVLASASAMVTAIEEVEEAKVVSTYKFTFDISTEVIANQETAIDVTFANNEPAGDYGYEGVRFKFNKTSGNGDVTFEATDSKGQPYLATNEGYWGPGNGFAIPAIYSAITPWKATFKAAGTYTFTISLVDAATDNVVAGITDTVTVEVKEAEDEAILAAFIEGLNLKATEDFEGLGLTLDTKIDEISGTGRMTDLFAAILELEEGYSVKSIAGIEGYNMANVKSAIVALMMADGRTTLGQLEGVTISIDVVYVYGDAEQTATYKLSFDISRLESSGEVTEP